MESYKWHECSQTNVEVTHKTLTECAELKKEHHQLTPKILRIHHTVVVGDTYAILPVHVPLDNKEFHFKFIVMYVDTIYDSLYISVGCTKESSFHSIYIKSEYLNFVCGRGVWIFQQPIQKSQN